MVGALPLGTPAPLDGRLPTDLAVDSSTPFSVYLHVPFCTVRCGYCDFNTYTATELRGLRQDAFADVLVSEIAMSAEIMQKSGAHRRASTVFFGGGTPTLLPPSDLQKMLDAVRDHFGVVPDAEVTVEANPDTVTQQTAELLAAAGVNRLSIGMQSAVPHVLAALDRTHNPDNVATAVAAARNSGLHVSLDLIYGAPGESLDDWRASLDQALALQPDHISAYALIIEEGTKLARQIRRREVVAPDDDLQADMYELADSVLAASGYSWYEVSNWARSDSDRSQHNMAYWQSAHWWGYGPGAHSHVAGLRWWNVKHPAAYAARLAAGESPAAGRERPDAEARYLEHVLLRSRMAEGLEISGLPDAARQRVADLIARELVDPVKALTGTVVLTRKGRLLADAVVRELTR
ncbi:radical SAM family heme chaperone HemW [Microbacterium sp. YY-01]|uniref:radical SAM family heme chaperone HemW n=1 Tax=Microbacterium sp. YY-01 TaxID=3421634 RepID=UPI003D1764F9